MHSLVFYHHRIINDGHNRFFRGHRGGADAGLIGDDTRKPPGDGPMHVHRSARIPTRARSSALLIALVITTSAVSRAATATSGFTITSSTSVQFWVHDAPWADLHYQINGGTQLNVRMVANGTNHTFDVTSIPSNATVRYFFT